MKRHRILGWDFDSRSMLIKSLKEKESLTELEIDNYNHLIHGIKEQFGESGFEQKLQNFIDIESKPFSVIAYHNSFLAQIRNAFVLCSYYPALIGACALGERILNHLILTLKEDFKHTTEYKKVFRKSSFDNWNDIIQTLTTWEVLLPNVAKKFTELKTIRNNSIHFNSSTETNTRKQALEAIILLQQIISEQFGTINAHWFIEEIPGELYIKKSLESNSFIKRIYISNSILVGYNHKVKSVFPLIITDEFEYENKEITDKEFADLRSASMRAIFSSSTPC